LEEKIIMKTHFLGIAAAMAVAGLISLVTARRIEAQYSSPVKVVNTTSAPAITSRMDDPGRIPYQSAIDATSCTFTSSCSVSFPPVPAGHRLVVTQIAGAHNGPQLGTGPFPVSVRIGLNGPSGSIAQFYWNLESNGSYVLPVSAYLDAGVSMVVIDSIFGSSYNNGSQFITLTGYMLDCTAAPCAAIAQ
jgi:hypothetical protein